MWPPLLRYWTLTRMSSLVAHKVANVACGTEAGYAKGTRPVAGLPKDTTVWRSGRQDTGGCDGAHEPHAGALLSWTPKMRQVDKVEPCP